MFGFEVEELPAHTVKDTRVSSTKIREAIAAGDVARARQWLGHPYPFSGRVVRGEQLGRKLGFPTANLESEEPRKRLPGRGSMRWARIAGTGNWQPAMVNMGTRPTVQDDGITETMEVHLLEGGRQCYDETMELQFMARDIRDEMMFEGLKALQDQLQQDAQKARSILATEPVPAP